MKCLAYSRCSESRQQKLSSCSESEWIKMSLSGHITMVWCVCVHLCVRVCANVSIGCRPHLPPTLFFETRLLIETGAQCFGYGSWSASSWNFCLRLRLRSAGITHTHAVMPDFCEAVGDLNPGPHAGVPNSFLTSLLPGPLVLHFLFPSIQCSPPLFLSWRRVFYQQRKTECAMNYGFHLILVETI